MGEPKMQIPERPAPPKPPKAPLKPPVIQQQDIAQQGRNMEINRARRISRARTLLEQEPQQRRTAKKTLLGGE